MRLVGPSLLVAPPETQPLRAVWICPPDPRGGHPSAEGGARPVPCGVPETRGTEPSCCPLLALDCPSLPPACPPVLPALLSGQSHSHLRQPPREPARPRRSAVPLALSEGRASPACPGGPAPGASERHTLAAFGPCERGGWVRDSGIEGISENSPTESNIYSAQLPRPAGQRPPQLSVSWPPAGSGRAERGAAALLSWAHRPRPGACVAPQAAATPRVCLLLCMRRRGPSRCFSTSVPRGGTKLVACGRLLRAPWCEGRTWGSEGSP